MKIDGVYEVKGDTLGHYVTVTFDPEKTSVEAFEKALSTEEFFVRGEPKFLK
jgi:ribosomal protein S6